MNRKISLSMIGLLAGAMLIGSASYAASYTVKPGDSLWTISNTYQITTSKLQSLNPQLTGDQIYPGQVLQVPGPSTYTVQKGETMWVISQKVGCTLSSLIQANPQLASPDNIWPGLTIFLPEGIHYNSAAVVTKPEKYVDGLFPLAKGTYSPLANNYGEGRDWSPTGSAARSHEGIDIFAKEGTKVYSAMDGTIINYGWSELGGWRLTIRVDGSAAFYYAHLSGYADGIRMGSTVKKGQLIGYVGSTGYGPVGTTGKFLPHLHFGIYQTNISPWNALDAFPYLRWWELNR